MVTVDVLVVEFSEVVGSTVVDVVVFAADSAGLVAWLVLVFVFSVVDSSTEVVGDLVVIVAAGVVVVLVDAEIATSGVVVGAAVAVVSVEEGEVVSVAVVDAVAGLSELAV